MTPEERAERLRKRFLFPEERPAFIAIVAEEIHGAVQDEQRRIFAALKPSAERAACLEAVMFMRIPDEWAGGVGWQTVLDHAVAAISAREGERPVKPARPGGHTHTDSPDRPNGPHDGKPNTDRMAGAGDLVAQEREACAKIAAAYHTLPLKRGCNCQPEVHDAAEGIAAAIRARAVSGEPREPAS